MITFSLQYKEAMKIAKKLAHSAGKEQIRYYLMGFFLHRADDGKHYAVSTDGLRLTRLEVSPTYEGEFPPVIFPTAAIKQIEGLKPDKESKAIVTFKVDGLGYSIECEGQSAGGKLIDGTYPDYQRVIPAGWPDYSNEYGGCGLSAALLAEIAKAAAYDADFLKPGKSRPIRIFSENNSPSVITECGDPSVLYVLMPMRTTATEHWHKPKSEKTQAENEAATAA